MIKHTRVLWTILLLVVGVSFAVVLHYGRAIYQAAPPIPTQVVTSSNQVVFSGETISKGQSVWLQMGGQELGTVWGHGAYLAPDWSADWLHRQALAMQSLLAKQMTRKSYQRLSLTQRAAVDAQLKAMIRTNTYNAATGKLVISPLTARAIAEVARHYEGLFGSEKSLDKLRVDYSMPANTVPTKVQRQQLAAFFYWTAWASVTNRPGETFSYTSNWPADSLVGNTPPGSLVMVSMLSVLLLLAGIGSLAWYHAVYLRDGFHDPSLPTAPQFGSMTASMKATKKFFFVVGLLIVAQIIFGVLTAHYTVEGNALFGLPIAKWLPYTVTRTWHVQLGLFWIATGFLATGLFVAPLVSGVEPRWQTAGINFLFICLLIIVAGSLAGEWMGIHFMMDSLTNFWLGMQGYEYVDLGRFWQSFLFVGLLVWLGLMMRSLLPALKARGEDKNLLILFILSCVTIAAFYGAGLLWGRHTNLSIVEYWRWWVVHLWVEGFFEVFAAVAMAFLFTRLGLLELQSATKMALLTTIIYMAGGILGVFHHLYFTGTPQGVIAVGGVFSALEVVPLTLMGFEAYHNYRLSKAQPWVETYHWPIYFFIAVCFWNLVGAGLFGFLINMPIALYYVQGLNTTPLHGHAALYGVYGNLAIGLMLFCLVSMRGKGKLPNRLLHVAFWGMNAGIAAMCLFSLLPVGLLQVWTSLTHDMWFARSPAFTAQPLIHNLIWARAFGDVLYGIGAVALALAVGKLCCSKKA